MLERELKKRIIYYKKEQKILKLKSKEILNMQNSDWILQVKDTRRNFSNSAWVPLRELSNEEQGNFQGDEYAQYYIGTMYEECDGVEQNIITAKEWFGKSCDSGNQDGCEQYRIINLE
ncbi:hypothetical protein ACTXMT_12015 [Psychrobacter faecalis]|uniref:hypothetical protein n=1 Tax=Psychrobacter faecalis TaxID=180588 RepID=UPI003FD0949F